MEGGVAVSALNRFGPRSTGGRPSRQGLPHTIAVQEKAAGRLAEKVLPMRLDRTVTNAPCLYNRVLHCTWFIAPHEEF